LAARHTMPPLTLVRLPTAWRRWERLAQSDGEGSSVHLFMVAKLGEYEGLPYCAHHRIHIRKIYDAIAYFAQAQISTAPIPSGPFAPRAYVRLVTACPETATQRLGQVPANLTTPLESSVAAGRPA